jgi:integrase/recombinase XerD
VATQPKRTIEPAGGAALPVVQSTLGHGNIAVTSGYLHVRPGDSSGLHLDEGVFLQRG